MLSCSNGGLLQQAGAAMAAASMHPPRRLPPLNAPCVRLLQVLVGNKSDMADEKRAVAFAKGQALADEYGIRFFETSAKDNLNVEEVRCRLCVCVFACVAQWA
jgi:GTPase SAR1 family protein